MHKWETNTMSDAAVMYCNNYISYCTSTKPFEVQRAKISLWTKKTPKTTKQKGTQNNVFRIRHVSQVEQDRLMSSNQIEEGKELQLWRSKMKHSLKSYNRELKKKRVNQWLERCIISSDFNGKQTWSLVKSILTYTGVTQLYRDLLCNTLNFECKYSSQYW